MESMAALGERLMLVRTRFAPSPTGYLHVGGVRTALFSWLYARHYQGTFILRIEDTDSMRSTVESTQAILSSMQWLGLEYDEGPFHQSERYDRYFAVAEQLIAQGSAYRCYCDKDRLEALRAKQMINKDKPRYDGHCRELDLPIQTGQDFVIRFKNPTDGLVSFEDQVYGIIQINNSELDDLILIRSDGHPTYNFSVVVDDVDMGITHVIRGDDHINNTPKQINILRALNVVVPIYAHVPMILGQDGKRLSKRHGAVSVLQFKELGYLPQALLNYLVRLGWSAGDQEIFSLSEMIHKFDLQHIHRGHASFDYDKLQWLNQRYLKTIPVLEVTTVLAEQFSQAGIDITNGPELASVVAIFADRSKTVHEMFNHSKYLYTDEIIYDSQAMEMHWRPTILEPLNFLYGKLQDITNWQLDTIHQAIMDVIHRFSIKMGQIAPPIRLAVTGSTSSPSIDIILQLLGKERTLKRLEYVLKYCHLL